MIWFKIYIIVITIIVDTYKSGSKFRLHQLYINLYQFIYHYFEYKPMGAHGLIFEGAYIRMGFFCQQIIGLIFEGVYNLGGLYSRFYSILAFLLFILIFL